MTQRKKIKDTVEHTNALPGCLADSLPDLIFYKDSDGVYLGCNRAFARFIERDMDNIAGFTDYDFFDHELADSFRQHDKRVLDTGKQHHNEEWVTHPDRGKILLDTVRTLHFGPDAQLLGVIGVSRDITRHFQSRDALQKNHDMLNRAQHIGRVGSWSWELKTNHLFWTDEIYRIFGLSPQQFAASYEAFLERVHPEDREQVQKEVQKALNGSAPYHTEHRIVLPDGSQRIVSERGEVEHDETGQPIRMTGTVHDITAFKKIETELKNHQEQLEDLVKERTRKLQDEIDERNRTEEKLKILSKAVEYSPASVVITDLQGTIEYVNPKFTELTQYTLDEAIGRNPRVLKSGVHSPKYYLEMWETILSGRQWCGEFCNKKKDGEIFWEKAAIAPIKNDQGEITHFVGVKEDITAQREMISELRKAKEAADQANEAKSLFLSSMSHELRTPLNTILGFAQLLESDDRNPLLPMQQHSINLILSAGKHLLQLISEIFDLAKIEAGVLEMSMEDVNLQTLLEDVITYVTPMAQKQEVEIILQNPDKEYFVKADVTRLKQVMINLLTNAVKYNKPGGTVTLDSSQADDSSILVNVTDDGPGIPQNKIAKVFTPFDRLGAETSSIQGTGIGLTITKRLVELMNGRIEVTSEWKKGSCFSVHLPLTKSCQEIIAGASTGDGGQETPVPKGEFTILYIEDNPANRQLVLFILARRPNFKLVMAENGEEGIDMACRIQPDIILMDISLPDMSGYDALAHLHTLPETHHIPVVALSANALPFDIKKGMKAGFTNYLTKPVNVNELFQTLDKILTSTENKKHEKSSKVKR